MDALAKAAHGESTVALLLPQQLDCPPPLPIID